MPIREPVFDPPFNVVRASHVELGVRDLARSRAFYVDCLGLLVSDETDEALYLRGVEERNHHSIVLRQSRTADVRALGFKLASEEDLDRAAFWFGRRNLPTSFPDLPHQGGTLRTVDTLGMPLDFYAQMDRSACMLQQYSYHLGARIQRIPGRPHRRLTTGVRAGAAGSVASTRRSAVGVPTSNAACAASAKLPPRDGM